MLIKTFRIHWEVLILKGAFIRWWYVSKFSKCQCNYKYISHRTRLFIYCYQSVYTINIKKNSEETSLRVNFQNEGHKNIGIHFCDGTIFLFSGKFLTRYQNCSDLYFPKDEIFVNFASYGTQRLFHHIYISFKHNDL